MLLGLFAGIFYAATSSFEGKPPRLACTCGPFKEGKLFYNGTHITHWILAAPCSVLSILLGSYNFAAFCIVMTLHGLSYSTEKLPEVEPVDDVGELDSDPELEMDP